MNHDPADYLTSAEAVQAFLADAFAADDTGNPMLRPSALAIALRALVRLGSPVTTTPSDSTMAQPVPWERRFANYDGKGDPQIQSMHAELAEWRARGRICVAVKPIRTEADHAAALARIETLLTMVEPEAERDSPEGDELELLSIVIHDYECQRWPLPDPWFEQVEAHCKLVGVPFDPLDPELTIASLIIQHGCQVAQVLGVASGTDRPEQP